MWCADSDYALDGGVRVEEEDGGESLFFFFARLYIFEGCIAEDAPEFFAAFDCLHTRYQAAHAMADENHLIEDLMFEVRVEGSAEFGKVGAHLCCADPEGLTCGILVEPELVVFAQFAERPQVIEHGHPSHRTGP